MGDDILSNVMHWVQLLCDCDIKGISRKHFEPRFLWCCRCCRFLYCLVGSGARHEIQQYVPEDANKPLTWLENFDQVGHSGSLRNHSEAWRGQSSWGAILSHKILTVNSAITVLIVCLTVRIYFLGGAVGSSVFYVHSPTPPPPPKNPPLKCSLFTLQPGYLPLYAYRLSLIFRKTKIDATDFI